MEASCTGFCASLFTLGCIADQDECTIECVESMSEECQAETIAYYECSAENTVDCKTRPVECVDLATAFEDCLGN